jgi:hypothetical protein
LREVSRENEASAWVSIWNNSENGGFSLEVVVRLEELDETMVVRRS